MSGVIALAQSAAASSPELEMLRTAPVGVLIVVLLLSAAITGALFGLALKLVGERVLRQPVAFKSAFAAMFAVGLIRGVIQLALFRTQGSAADFALTGGMAFLALSLVVSGAVVAWSVRTFLNGPDNPPPRWGQAAMIAAIMMAIELVFSIVVVMSGGGPAIS